MHVNISGLKPILSSFWQKVCGQFYPITLELQVEKLITTAVYVSEADSLKNLGQSELRQSSVTTFSQL
jgi:hypothetical protein